MYNSDLMPCLLIFSPAHLYIDVIINIESTVHIHEGGTFIYYAAQSLLRPVLYMIGLRLCVFILALCIYLLGRPAPGAGFLKFVSKSPQFDLDTLCP
jgi:hypothetical protein